MYKVVPISFPEPVEMKYNPFVDMQDVDQFGFVNLRSAFENGTIDGSVASPDESFNGVSNPGTLLPRVTDVFDGLRKAEFVRSRLESLNKREREKAEANAAAATAAVGASE